MIVLLTGASGFIGRRLAKALLDAGHELRCAGRERANSPYGSWVFADFTRDHSVADWLPRLAGVDVVVNAVGIIAERGEQTFEALHVRAPVALFDACVQAGVRRVVQISALGADQHATSRYHLSKKAADDALLRLPLSAAVAQPSLVYGPGGTSARLFDRLASLPLVPLPAGGTQPLQPIFIDDLVQALVQLVARPEVTGRVPLVGARPVSLREWLQDLRRSMGLGHLRGLPVAAALMGIAAAAGERLPGGLLDRDTWSMLQRGNTAPVAATAALLGRAPRSTPDFIPQEHADAARLQAQLGWLLPVLRLSIAAVWIVTGLLSLGGYPVQDSYALLARTGLHDAAASVALYGAALLDLLLGLAVLVARRPWLWLAQIGLILAYTAIISWKLPEFWLHPYGPILKNLPMLAALWLLYECERPTWTT